MNNYLNKENLIKTGIFFLSLFAGAFLRFQNIFIRGSFVFDEFMTLEGSRSLSNLITTIKLENTPPFYWFFSYVWTRLLPVTEFNARLPAVLFSVGAIIASYYLAKLIEPKKYIASLSMLLFSLSPYLVWFSGFARHYSLLSLLSVWHAYEAIKIAKGKKNFSYRFLASAWILSLTHLFGAFQVIITYLFLLFQSAEANRQKMFKVVFILLFPVLFWFAIQLPERLAINSIEELHFFSSQTSVLRTIISMFLSSFVFFNADIPIWAALISVAILFYKIPQLIKKNPEILYITIVAVAPLILIGIMRLNALRYYSVSAPLIIVLVNYLLYKTHNKIVFVATYLTIISAMLISNIQLSYVPGACFDRVANDLEDKKNVFIAPPAVAPLFKYYSKNPAAIRGLDGDYNLDSYADRVRYNYRVNYTSKSLDTVLSQLGQFDAVTIAAITQKPVIEPSFWPLINKAGFASDSEKRYRCLQDIGVYNLRKKVGP